MRGGGLVTAPARVGRVSGRLTQLLTGGWPSGPDGEGQARRPGPIGARRTSTGQQGACQKTGWPPSYGPRPELGQSSGYLSAGGCGQARRGGGRAGICGGDVRVPVRRIAIVRPWATTGASTLRSVKGRAS